MRHVRPGAYWILGSVAVLQLAACETGQPGPVELESDVAASVVTSAESWASQFGTAGNDVAFSVAIHGSAIYAGGFVDGPGFADAWVSGHDRQGNVVWTRSFDTGGFDEVRGVGADASGVYAVGWVDGTLPDQAALGGGDAYIRKYDADGTELWTHQFGTPARDNAIAVEARNGIVYVAGFTWGTLPGQASAGGADGFIRAYDADGNELWTRQFGTDGEDLAIGLTVEARDLYITGSTGGSFGSDGNAGGGGDVFVQRFDLDGNNVWTRQFGSAGFDMGMNVAADARGVYVTGFASDALPGFTYAGGGDVFVRAYDRSGGELWTDQFGSAGFDSGTGVATLGGRIHVAGSVGAMASTPTSGPTDGFLRTYGRDGETIGTRVFGSDAGDQVAAVAVQGGIFVFGTTSGTLEGQTSLGGNDLFLMGFRLP